MSSNDSFKNELICKRVADKSFIYEGCIAITIRISITTVLQIYMQIHVQMHNTGGFYSSPTNGFINFLNSVLRHEERDTILTWLTILNAWRILWC